MSIERVKRKSGAVWRVRWRENGQPHSRVMGTKRDAELFEADVTRRKRLGQLAQIDAGRETVAEFAREWWRIHAEPNLAARTRESYAVVFDKHILPRVGGLPLREVTPAVVAGLSADLKAAGVGPAAARRALTVLQGIFSCAVTWGHVQSNPVVGVRKPSAKRQRAVEPPSVALVERMRAELLAERRQRDATLLVVLAYAGLRPQEALALPWRDVRDRTLLIDRAQSDEGPKTTKTGRTRSVRLLAPLAADLAAWRLASARSGADELVCPTATRRSATSSARSSASCAEAATASRSSGRRQGPGRRLRSTPPARRGRRTVTPSSAARYRRARRSILKTKPASRRSPSRPRSAASRPAVSCPTTACSSSTRPGWSARATSRCSPRPRSGRARSWYWSATIASSRRSTPAAPSTRSPNDSRRSS